MSRHIFGTDGIRALVGTSPLTAPELQTVGHAIAQWAVATFGNNPHILIGRDTRISGEWLSAALSSGMLSYPTTLSYAGIIPTPALSALLKTNPAFDCALMISASHNPYHDNGIKLIARTTGKISDQDEKEINNSFYNPQKHTYQTFGITKQYNTIEHNYQDYIQTKFDANFLSGTKILLDCAHGATSRVAPSIFKGFGALVVAINIKPTGININNQCGALHPDAVQKAVLAHNADIGFAFDGDGDRVITVNKNGIMKNGDDMLALLSQHTMYRNDTTIVGTVMSNYGFERWAKKQHKKLVRTAVGDRHIADYLMKHDQLLGGEQSGHIIMRDYLPTGDGIFTALRIAEIMKHTGNSELETFTHYPQKLTNIPVRIKKDLHHPTIASIITKHKTALCEGRLLVRYSGTENLLRIMVEDKKATRVDDVSAKLAQELTHALQ